MNKGLKTRILSLRKQGKSYREIRHILSCSLGTISFHCSKDEHNAEMINHNRLRNRDPETDQIINAWTSKTTNLIKTLYNFGINTSDISEALTISAKALRKYCRADMKHPDYSHLSAYERVKKRRRKLKIMALIYKGGKCTICGYDKNITSLTFHHNDPDEKDFAISTRPNAAWKTIKNEIEKCTLVCRNCHMEIHNKNENGNVTKLWKDIKQILHSQ